MWTRNLWCAAILGVAIVGCVGTLGALAAQDQARAKRAEFMRLKLDYAKEALEGLTTDNLDKVARNARELKLMSAAAQWEVPSVPKVEYNSYTSEFQRICQELAEQASKKNLDGATLAYVQLTMNCVNCHKYVRTVNQ